MNKSEARRQLVKTYQRTVSLAQTARRWQSAAAVPIPAQERFPPALEQQVIQLRKQIGYGRRRLSRQLWHRSSCFAGLVLFWLRGQGMGQNRGESAQRICASAADLVRSHLYRLGAGPW